MNTVFKGAWPEPFYCDVFSAAGTCSKKRAKVYQISIRSVGIEKYLIHPLIVDNV
jgi:hypothetical protein